jgi:hypothetical protein
MLFSTAGFRCSKFFEKKNSVPSHSMYMDYMVECFLPFRPGEERRNSALVTFGKSVEKMSKN